MTVAKPRSRVSGIDRTLQILDFLSERGESASAYDIAKSVGAPVSTIYALVDELVDRQVLMRADGNGIWLGPRLFRYGLAFESGADVLIEAKREMERLSRQVGETVQICVRDEGMMVVAAMADGAGHFRISSDVGTRVPLNWTASGRLLVGHLPDGERERVFAQVGRRSPTGKAETDPARLARQAGADFRNRLAVQLGASDFAVACIAAPIRNTDGQCVATISIVSAESKAEANLDAYGQAVRDGAGRIERSLGWASE